MAKQPVQIGSAQRARTSIFISSLLRAASLLARSAWHSSAKIGSKGLAGGQRLAEGQRSDARGPAGPQRLLARDVAAPALSVPLRPLCTPQRPIVAKRAYQDRTCPGDAPMERRAAPPEPGRPKQGRARRAHGHHYSPSCLCRHRSPTDSHMGGLFHVAGLEMMWRKCIRSLHRGGG